MKARKMTLASNLKIAWPVILAIAFLAWMLFNGSNKEFISIALCLFIAPALFLHVEYFAEDWRKEVTYDFGNRRIEVSKKGVRTSLALDDVTTILIVDGVFKPQIWRHSPAWFHYSYLIFYLQNGEKLTVTCLIEDPADHMWDSIHDNVQRATIYYPMLK